MPAEYLPIFVFLLLALALPVLSLLALRLVRPSAPSKVKQEAYECGIEPLSNSRGRYTVRFYVLAILFVIFETETVFLFPWAVALMKLPRATGQWAFWSMLAFLVDVTLGYVYVWKRGALEWE